MADCSRRRIHAGTECIWNANNLLWPGRNGICILDSLKGTCKMLPRINCRALKFKETLVCLMLYLFCSCSEAAPALSSDTRGCWVVPTLWTSHRRFLHAVKPTRKQASSSRTPRNKTSGALSKRYQPETCTKTYRPFALKACAFPTAWAVHSQPFCFMKKPKAALKMNTDTLKTWRRMLLWCVSSNKYLHVHTSGSWAFPAEPGLWAYFERAHVSECLNNTWSASTKKYSI